MDVFPKVISMSEKFNKETLSKYPTRPRPAVFLGDACVRTHLEMRQLQAYPCSLAKVEPTRAPKMTHVGFKYANEKNISSSSIDAQPERAYEANKSP